MRVHAHVCCHRCVCWGRMRSQQCRACSRVDFWKIRKHLNYSTCAMHCFCRWNARFESFNRRPAVGITSKPADDARVCIIKLCTYACMSVFDHRLRDCAIYLYIGCVKRKNILRVTIVGFSFLGNRAKWQKHVPTCSKWHMRILHKPYSAYSAVAQTCECVCSPWSYVKIYVPFCPATVAPHNGLSDVPYWWFFSRASSERLVALVVNHWHTQHTQK